VMPMVTAMATTPPLRMRPRKRLYRIEINRKKPGRKTGLFV
jgi:hypothetical protein